jgi:hypothetical protein
VSRQAATLGQGDCEKPRKPDYRDAYSYGLFDAVGNASIVEPLHRGSESECDQSPEQQNGTRPSPLGCEEPYRPIQQAVAFDLNV